MASGGPAERPHTILMRRISNRPEAKFTAALMLFASTPPSACCIRLKNQDLTMSESCDLGANLVQADHLATEIYATTFLKKPGSNELTTAQRYSECHDCTLLG
jgi:hypothetical protein